MAEAKEIEKMFVGYDKGKVQAIDFYNDDQSGEWKLKYKDENGRMVEVGNSDRAFMEELFMEFGGRNPETCKAPSKFLALDGSWGSKELKRLGHTITKIHLVGYKSHRNRRHPYSVPEDCGEAGAIKSNKNTRDDVVVAEGHHEKCEFTRSFSYPEEFDNLVRFIRGHECLSDLTFTVRKMCTESSNKGEQCVWERCQAGDGTKRMVLELKRLNGEEFENCPRKHLFDAAGDMFDAPCKRVKMEKTNKPFERDICLFAVDDGKVDVSGYRTSEKKGRVSK